MAPRKAVEKELSRDIIMNAARQMFAEKGYQQVSMRQIAKQLNYSHGAIYYHFKNKAELFYALVEEHFDLLNEVLDSILEQQIEDQQKIHQILLGFIKFGLNNQSHYEIMFLIKDEEVKSYLNTGPNITYEKFAQSLYELSNQSLTLQEIWSIFLSIHGFVSHYCGEIENFDQVKTIAEAHCHFLIKNV
ncbi:TetR/AcrR family transcriptional regulator [Aquibacillus kalidii]|uniref:TetR/AcrR family transcriptional regulator n=1 Tax=Aquibacillus kalidii TaxID=2762597 RepID=UPI00164718C7|nr:TetR/AcrR family transcriptional regulator [Aquibacillus kalidii]